MIAEVAGRPVHPGAGGEYYLRNGADASLDVNEISGGEARTIVPGEARATLSMRLAPGQDAKRMHRCPRSACSGPPFPRGPSSRRRDATLADPALVRPEEPALQLAAEALRRACGAEPVFMRSGGSIPIVAEMAARGYPVIVSGFALAEDQIHAPDESFSLHSLEWGEAAARELYAALSTLSPRS